MHTYRHNDIVELPLTEELDAAAMYGILFNIIPNSLGPNHRPMARVVVDGYYDEVSNLPSGTRVMPFYLNTYMDKVGEESVEKYMQDCLSDMDGVTVEVSMRDLGGHSLYAFIVSKA